MTGRKLIRSLAFVLMLAMHISCNSQQTEIADELPTSIPIKSEVQTKTYDTTYKTIHVLVALCDNKYQGIVPVPASLGNGQNPNTNLYWGSAYGIKNYFKKSKEWTLIETRKTKGTILERSIFKHKKSNYYLIADAYDGQFIKETTINFLNNSCGNNKDTLQLKDKTIGISGNSNLIAYIGHDGLMDFKLDASFKNTDGQKRDLIILACYSKHFFSDQLQQANARPLLWTSGLMAPEAYTLHDALGAYINNESNPNIQLKAAKAYAKYQKCSLSAAKRLLLTGW